MLLLENKDFREFVALLNSHDELLANKRAAGRPQDLADVAKLEAPGKRSKARVKTKPARRMKSA